MKKKIIAQAVCAILIFIVGIAFGGYRGTNRLLEQRNVGDLNWYIMFHMMAIRGENEKAKKTAEMGINMIVQSLRDSENGVNSSSFWLCAFSLGDGFLDDEDVKLILKENAKYPISNVAGLTEENLAYLKSKRE